MSKINFIIICLLLSLNSNSQTIERLDNNYGFKKFIFGSSPSSIQNIKTYRVYGNKKFFKNYIYTSTDILTFSGIRIYRIELNFYKDKLFQISLRMDQGNSEYTELNYEIVMTTLEANFGKNNATCEPFPTSFGKIINCAIWDAKKVKLEHTRVLLTDLGVVTGSLLFTEKNIKQQQELDEM